MKKEEKNTITIIKTMGKSILASIPGILIATGSLILANIAIDKNKKH